MKIEYKASVQTQAGWRPVYFKAEAGKIKNISTLWGVSDE